MATTNFDSSNYLKNITGQNGSAINKTNNKPYISCGQNLFKLDLTSKQFTLQTTSGGTNFNDIAGIAFLQNTQFSGRAMACLIQLSLEPAG